MGFHNGVDDSNDSEVIQNFYNDKKLTKFEEIWETFLKSVRILWVFCHSRNFESFLNHEHHSENPFWKKYRHGLNFHLKISTAVLDW